MRALPILLAAGISAGALAAQGFTSPAGYLTTEGSSNHDYILFKYTDMRWQQLDDTSVGQPPTLVQRVSWRRDGTSGFDATWAARAMDVEVVLSNSVPASTVSLDFNANYTTMTSTAFVMKPVNLPDWTAVPVSTPAPFDLVLQLDTPWPYLGLEPFLWEVRTTNNLTGTDYGNDFQSLSGAYVVGDPGAAIGTGCLVSGQSGPMSLAATFYNLATEFRFNYSVTNAPPATSVFANLDLVNANLPIPGLCANVVAAPTITFQLGVTDALGAAALSLGGVPFRAGLVGVPIYSQVLAIDGSQPGLPVALSNGRSNALPATPTNPVQVTRLYEYRLASGSMRAPSRWTGGIVTRFD